MSRSRFAFLGEIAADAIFSFSYESEIKSETFGEEEIGEIATNGVFGIGWVRVKGWQWIWAREYPWRFKNYNQSSCDVSTRFPKSVHKSTIKRKLKGKQKLFPFINTPVAIEQIVIISCFSLHDFNLFHPKKSSENLLPLKLPFPPARPKVKNCISSALDRSGSRRPNFREVKKEIKSCFICTKIAWFAIWKLCNALQCKALCRSRTLVSVYIEWQPHESQEKRCIDALSFVREFPHFCRMRILIYFC